MKWLPSYSELEHIHKEAWSLAWFSVDIVLKANDKSADALQQVLRLHVSILLIETCTIFDDGNLFHMIQTVSLNTTGYDVSAPARGLHGESYRGRIRLLTSPLTASLLLVLICWMYLIGEISSGTNCLSYPFILCMYPKLLRLCCATDITGTYSLPLSSFFHPCLSCTLLYLFLLFFSFLFVFLLSRLNRARQLAKEAGYKGAMFPWQSGSDGKHYILFFEFILGIIMMNI